MALFKWVNLCPLYIFYIINKRQTYELTYADLLEIAKLARKSTTCELVYASSTAERQWIPRKCVYELTYAPAATGRLASLWIPPPQLAVATRPWTVKPS